MANATAVFAPGQRLVDTSGTPYSGATVQFREAGTDTPKSVFADADLTVSLGSTVYTDSAGYPVTSLGGSTKTLVYTNDESYKVTIKTSAGVTIAEHDNCKGAVIASSGGGGSFLTQDAADVRYTRNANALSAITNLASGDTFAHWSAANAGNRGITWADLQTDMLSNGGLPGMFSAGARVLFQGTPPTGWTLETGAAYNDAALRFTTGTPATGGSVAFSTLFASQTLTGTVGSSGLSIANLAVHDHSDSSAAGSVTVAAGSDVTIKPNTGTTGSAGSSTGHAHSLIMNAFNMAVKYASVNIGQKA
ncbi:MAG: hypothetical protein IPM06_18010 [Rhizobiales bacterium]|nr:hypothetical protein [Hyphomicrobiales bacterium]